MIDARFVPIDTWPGTKTDSWKRKASLFKAAYSKTLDLLEGELKKIAAKDILIQTWLQREQIRNDGWPKSNAAKPKEPGVILTFVRAGKTVSMPCDKYRDWEDNLGAIALSLQALRAVDRYGVTQSGEQYRGWESLPPPSTSVEMTDEIAEEIISRWSSVPKEWIRKDPVQAATAIREAIKRTHPDKGGRAEDFLSVQKAANAMRGMR